MLNYVLFSLISFFFEKFFAKKSWRSRKKTTRNSWVKKLKEDHLGDKKFSSKKIFYLSK